MPGFLWGVQLDLGQTLREHVYGLESIIGIPMQVVADTLIGFLVFGVVLATTGGGAFFMDFASALLGTLARRPGQGGDHLLGPLRHAVGQPDLERADHRHADHPDDEALRLSSHLCRCGRGLRVDRRLR